MHKVIAKFANGKSASVEVFYQALNFTVEERDLISKAKATFAEDGFSEAELEQAQCEVVPLSR